MGKREDAARAASEWIADSRRRLDAILDRHGTITHVLGVDESGTGAWAGPFVLCAVLAPRKWDRQGVMDSKKTDKVHREHMFAELEGDPHVVHGEGFASPDDIARLSHAQAYCVALDQAVKNVLKPNKVPMKNLAIIVDGKGSSKIRDTLLPHGCINVFFVEKADAFVPQVGAASIIAKFNRDVEMNMLDKKFPGYYFNTNAGYGTPDHIEALVNLGPVPHVHRPER